MASTERSEGPAPGVPADDTTPATAAGGPPAGQDGDAGNGHRLTPPEAAVEVMRPVRRVVLSEPPPPSVEPADLATLDLAAPLAAPEAAAPPIPAAGEALAPSVAAPASAAPAATPARRTFEPWVPGAPAPRGGRRPAAATPPPPGVAAGTLVAPPGVAPPAPPVVAPEAPEDLPAPETLESAAPAPGWRGALARSALWQPDPPAR